MGVVGKNESHPMFATPRRNDDEITRARILALMRWGFVEVRGDRWLLTDKGWRALSAAAEPRRAPVTQAKAAIEFELRQWADDIVRVAAWRH
jgi:hypothetical protein